MSEDYAKLQASLDKILEALQDDRANCNHPCRFEGIDPAQLKEDLPILHGIAGTVRDAGHDLWVSLFKGVVKVVGLIFLLGLFYGAYLVYDKMEKIKPIPNIGTPDITS